MKHYLILSLTTALFLASCKKDETSPAHGTETFTGSEVALYGGKANTWVTMNNGVPQQLAISINDAAMSSLPTDGDGSETEISLPALITGTTVNHVALDWNPHGHEPEGIYSVPHFDFHFYTVSKDEQMNIPAYEADSTGFQKFPAPQYLPANYIPIPGGVPMMGKHWVDVTSPELNGKPFTQTFIYGSYNSKVIFYEPMITKAFLDTAVSFERSIPQPAGVQQGGYYPAKLKVAKHDGVTEIILSDFALRNQQ